jgi:hypothetical protein
LTSARRLCRKATVVEAFYLSRGDGRYLPTEHTVGPWTPDAQHFGPPSALLVRELEALPRGTESGAQQLARVTVEILGPAPLSELTVSAEVVRPGRSVELLSAQLTADDRVVARASAWRMAATDTDEVATGTEPPLPSVAECSEALWPTGFRFHGGYLDAVEWRTVRGAVTSAGPAAVWARQRVALVDDEKPSPLQRLFVIADSGSGVSNLLDPAQWLFINSELTVHVLREPVGEWIGLDAATAVGPRGVGIARSALHDCEGQVAMGTQALLVRHR